jgi:hypothetical protein
LVDAREVEELIDSSQHLSGLRFDIADDRAFLPAFGATYSNGSMTIEPVVLRPPMNLCAAAASRSEKVLTTLLATTPCATASNRDFAATSISLRFDK